jgi:hypothetical protein
LDVANSALKVLETEGAARSAAGGGVGPQSVPDPAKVPSIIGKLPDADLANGMIGSPAGLAKAAAKTSSRPRRGPKTDYQTALRVAEIANRIAGTEPWRSQIEDICDELDEKGVPRPKTWKAKGYRSWSTCTERHLVIEAIRHHLKRAKERPTETIL